ncbi:hypothetical protein I5R65_07810 [Herbaspirillum sp. AP02]|uniref:hypothetical protein n=1 Tax=unclassified Herbaspirillum TaxID=2624150 RepID=UPI0015DA9E54|nr:MULTISPECIES: hypothetical protein [unclassified Herbaspirillum]MBG7619366.1 hypothetical protein [Herbaspirillum sp. AP02]NZD66650.1 hypothetical protein [Herbaspirillum sp. AP21]
MTKVKVYQFECYDIMSDQFIRSKRWATTAAIARIPGATQILESGIEVDERVIESDIEGMTQIGFNPGTASGFQREIED